MKLPSSTVALAAALLPAALSAQAVALTPQVVRLTSVVVSEKQPTKTNPTYLAKGRDYIDGKRAGRDTLTCKVSQGKTFKLRCTILFELARGTITAKFTLLSDVDSGRGTISAGSGMYAGATGTMTFQNVNKAGTRTHLVLHLR